MADIVPFPQRRCDPDPRDDVVWACACGNASFFLFPSGHVECAQCYAPIAATWQFRDGTP